MARGLSERQRRILEFVEEFLRQNRFPPTIRDIADAVGVASTSVIKYNLDTLERKGYIERDVEISRSIRLVQGMVNPLGEVIQVPLLGRVAVGMPIPVPDVDFSPFGQDATIELTRDIVKDVEGIYALEVQGDSMIDALVDDGDIVLIRYQDSVENGELAAVWLRDREETTLKRYYREGDRVRLQPANPTMRPAFYPADNVQIMGKVLCVIRQLV